MNLDKSLYQILESTVNLYPTYPALYFENKQIKYKKVLEEVDKLASFLQSINVKSGDIVTVCMPNMPQAVYAIYAINKIGAVCYEIHPKTELNAMKDYLLKVKSKVLLVIDIFCDKFLSLVDTLDLTIVTFNPFANNNFIMKTLCDFKSRKANSKVIKYEDVKIKDINVLTYNWDNKKTSVLLNTGGTSGTSKIVEISNLAINKLASNGTKILGITNPYGVYMLGVLPLFHGFGLCMGIHSPMMYGACVSLMMKFNVKKTIKLLKSDHLTIIIGVPTLYKLLLKNPKFKSNKLKNLTSCYVGGDFVSERLVNEFNEVMEKYNSSARLYEGYGLTETVTVCAVNTRKDNLLGSVGKAVDNCTIKIVDKETKKEVEPLVLGEIVVSGDILMNGYFNDVENTLKSFIIINNKKYLLTGDYGYIDKDGFVFFKQRLKRIIKVSGVVCCPSEIENEVLKLNEVGDAYATSISDEEKGEIVKLFIVKKNPNISNEELTKKIKEVITNNLSIFACPKQVIYVDFFPKTEIGKTDGKALEELYK